MDTQDGILGTNMYAYCQGDPVNFCDTGGMFKADIHTGKGDRKTGKGYGTYFWALDYFKKTLPLAKAKSYADIVAKANQSIDNDLSPISMWYSSEAQSWHFNINFGTLDGSANDSRMIHYEESMGTAFANLTMAGFTSGSTRETYINRALQAMGRGLHARQDMISHTGFGGNMPVMLGQTMTIITYVHWPWGIDEVTVGDRNFNEAKAATESTLRTFMVWGRMFGLW